MYALVLISFLMNTTPAPPPGQMGPTSALVVGEFKKPEDCKNAATANSGLVVSPPMAAYLEIAFLCVKKSD
jgi:hypothetical protein